MPDGLRRNVAELVTRYLLEPTLRDVFVEGRFDARVLQWFFEKCGAEAVSVYEIGTVNINATELADTGLADNSRSRVIWLALQLCKDIGQETRTVTCVADSDFDFVAERQYTCGLLFYTDFTGMEMYFFANEVLEKALRVGARLDVDVAGLLGALEPLLHRMFACRCANVLLGWGMTWYEPWKCVELEASRITFDEAQFVDRYLNKNARAGQRADFLAKLTEVTEKGTAQPMVRGHDAFDALGWFLRKQGTRAELCDRDVLLALMVSCASIEHLLQFPLFQRLRSRLC